MDIDEKDSLKIPNEGREVDGRNRRNSSLNGHKNGLNTHNSSGLNSLNSGQSNSLSSGQNNSFSGQNNSLNSPNSGLSNSLSSLNGVNNTFNPTFSNQDVYLDYRPDPSQRSSNLSNGLRKSAASNLSSGLKKTIPGAVAGKKPVSSAPTLDMDNGGRPTECSNCRTQNTPLWRKDPHGNTLCNACGLFYKLHGTTRPLSLKTDVIKKRLSRRSTSSILRHALVTSMTAHSPATAPRPLAPISAKPSPAPGSSGNSFLTSMPSNTRYKNVLILPKPSGNTTSPSSTTSSVPGTPTSQVSAHSIPIPRNASHLSFAGNQPSSLPLTLMLGSQLFKRKKSDFNIAASTDYYDGKRSSISLMSGSLSKRNGAKRASSVTSLSHLLQSQPQSLSFSNVNMLNQRFNGSFFDTASELKHTSERQGSVSTIGAHSLHDVGQTQDGIVLDTGHGLGGIGLVAPQDVTMGDVATPGSYSSHSSYRQPSIADFRRMNGYGEISSIPATPLNTVDLLPSSTAQNTDVEMEMDAAYFRLQAKQNTAPKSSLSNGLKRQMEMPEKEFKDLDWLKFEL